MVKSKRNIIIYGTIFLGVLGCFVMYIFLSRNTAYIEVKYEIKYPSDTLFTLQEFSSYVDKVNPLILGKKFTDINLSVYEKNIETYPYISDAEVVNNRGILVVKAIQEKIIARVLNNKDEWFWLAQSGKFVPKTKKNPGRILVINGNINEGYSKDNNISRIKQGKNAENYPSLILAWKIACFVSDDLFWQAQISQIYINEKYQIELIPTVGEHAILFGSVSKHENIDEVIKKKFSYLKRLYEDGFKITGWDRYKLINMKYGREIPCEKRE